MVLGDNLRNAYFVPDGKVCVTKRLQHSLDEETDAPTQNNFATAWIDHGNGAVSGGGYEYMLVVHASDDDVARYREELPYEVLRRDASAHILRDKPSGVVAYALFAPGRVGEGLLESVSLPSLVMIGGGGDRLTVSAADPDLRFYEGPSDEVFDADGKRVERSIYSRKWIDNPSGASELNVVIRGRWQMDGDTPGCRTAVYGGNTVVTFTCREGATREVNLIEIR